MYIAPGQGQTAPRGQNLDVNRKAVSLYPFVANFKEISLKSDFIHFFFMIWYMYIWPFSHTNLIHVYLTFYPYKSIRDQIWPCRKIGQGQSRVIIWRKLVVLEHHMLHTKFQGHLPFGSREDFFKFFTIYGHGGHLGHVTRTVWTNFSSPIPWRLHMKFGFNRPSGFWEDV